MRLNLWGLALAFLLAVSPAQGQQTKANMTSEINTNFADNTSGNITPSLARTTYADMVNSWQQGPQIRSTGSGTDTITLADYGHLVLYSNTSAVTLPQATGGFTTFNFYARNTSGGTVTITPTTSSINGAASLILAGGQGAWIISDGANYQVGPAGIFGMGIGVSINNLKFVSSNYTIQASDCGNGVLAGGNAFFTITLPASGTIANPCLVTVLNADGSRAKQLSGFPTDNAGYLFPGQNVQVIDLGSEWATYTNPGRWRLSSAVSFFVDPVNGSDNNDGLAAGTGGAFATVGKFAQVLNNNIDTREFIVSVQFASGTYTNTLSAINLAVTGGGTVNFIGNNSTATSSVAGSPALGIQCAPQVGYGFNNSCADVQGFTLTCSGGGHGLEVFAGTVTVYINMVFGACPGGFHMLGNQAGASIILNANYSITGGAAGHFGATGGSVINFNSSAFTGTLTGTPAFSVAFAVANFQSQIISLTTWSGAATGMRYQASLGSSINTNGGGPNYFPGSTAGQSLSGGTYDSPGTPGVNSCGTSPVVTGTDEAGLVAFTGASTTNCNITFSTANAPFSCAISSNSTTLSAGLNLNTFTSAGFSISWTNAVTGAGQVVRWVCPQQVH